jgi:hypothetical protein
MIASLIASVFGTRRATGDDAPAALVFYLFEFVDVDHGNSDVNDTLRKPLAPLPSRTMLFTFNV